MRMPNSINRKSSESLTRAARAALQAALAQPNQWSRYFALRNVVYWADLAATRLKEELECKNHAPSES